MYRYYIFLKKLLYFMKALDPNLLNVFYNNVLVACC